MLAVHGLAGTPFFSDLSPAALEALVGRATERHFANDEVLFTAGSESRGLFVILEGKVRVLRGAPDGRQRVVHVEGPGGTLGEVPLFEGASSPGYPATAVAAAATRCAVVGRDALAAAMRVDPDVAWLLLRRLASRVRTLVEQLDRLAARDVGARLAEYLLARPADSVEGLLTLGATQLRVAEELGTVREVLVRELRQLRSDGLLRSAGRGKYAILDRNALEERANGTRSGKRSLR